MLKTLSVIMEIVINVNGSTTTYNLSQEFKFVNGECSEVAENHVKNSERKLIEAFEVVGMKAEIKELNYFEYCD